MLRNLVKEIVVVGSILRYIDMIKHMNEHGAMDLFDDLVVGLKGNAEQGTRAAMTSIGLVKARPNVASIIVGICHSIAGADGKLVAEEQAEIEEIARHLGVSNDVGAIVDASE